MMVVEINQLVIIVDGLIHNVHVVIDTFIIIYWLLLNLGWGFNLTAYDNWK